MGETGAYSWVAFIVGSGLIISILMRSGSDKRDEEEFIEGAPRGGDNPWKPPRDYGTRSSREIAALDNVLNDHNVDDYPDAESVANTVMTNLSIAETVYGINVREAVKLYDNKIDKLIIALSMAQSTVQTSFVELVTKYDAAREELNREGYSEQARDLPDMFETYKRERAKLEEHVAVISQYQRQNKYESQATELTDRVAAALQDYDRRHQYFESQLEHVIRFMEENVPVIEFDPLEDRADKGSALDDAMHGVFGTPAQSLATIHEVPPSNPPATRPTFTDQFVDDTPNLPSHEPSLITKPKATLDLARRLDFSGGSRPSTEQPQKQFTSRKQRPPPSAPRTPPRSAPITSRPVSRRTTSGVISGAVKGLKKLRKPKKSTQVNPDAARAAQQYRDMGALDTIPQTQVDPRALRAHQELQEMGAYESGEDL